MVVLTDLTREKPSKALVKFMLPMIVSVAFQQIYNIADKVIAGQFAENGESALAAISASYPVTMIIMAVALGTNIGCSIVISNLYGAKKYKDVKTATSTSIILAIVVGIALSALSLILCDPILKLMNTPENIFADTSLYLRIYIYGFTFLYLYNICTGVFNALGNSKTPLYFLIASSLSNIVLDYIFVAICGWGVAGVGWATFIAQGASSILALIALIFEIKKIKTNEPAPLLSASVFKRIIVLAVPSILQQSFVSIGSLMIQSLVNDHGSSAIAGYGVAIQLNTFAVTVFNTSSNAISNYTAQNMGNGDLTRVRQGFRAGLKIVAVIAIPFVAAYAIFGKYMVSIFLDNPTQEALDTGISFLRIVAPFYFAVMIKLVADGVLRGSGAVKFFVISTFSDLLLRVALAYIFDPLFGVIGIWLSWPIGWVISAVIAVVFYKKEYWIPKEKREAIKKAHEKAMAKAKA